jgi:uncharacterized protein (TIGR02145 family)
MDYSNRLPWWVRGTGEKLKETGLNYPYWNPPNPATNGSVFTAIPGGYWEDIDPNFHQMHNFCSRNNHGYWWSATESSMYPGSAYFHKLNYSDTRINTNEWFNKLAGMSVRCVKNP